ncbi:MAG: RES family NAD+ phosphorylase [Bacteroidota bacterium]
MTPHQIIEQLQKAYDQKELSYENMIVQFANIENIPFRSVFLKKGSSIIRARCNRKPNSYTKLSHINNPPGSLVSNFSRLNRPLQSLFYGSDSVETCLSEMLNYWINDFEINDRIFVTIGKWVLLEDIKLLLIPDTNNLNELNLTRLGEIGIDEMVFWDFISNKYKVSIKDDQDIYEFTSSFSNVLWLNALKQNIPVKGFVYTSVMSNTGINIALNPLSISNNGLILQDVQELTFVKNNSNNNGLPVYNEILKRKSGILNGLGKNITWTYK